MQTALARDDAIINTVRMTEKIGDFDQLQSSIDFCLRACMCNERFTQTVLFNVLF